MATTERRAFRTNGWIAVLVVLAAVVAGIAAIGLGAADEASADTDGHPALFAVGVVVLLLALVAVRGFIVVPPNQGKLLTFFGKYTGTVRDEGFHWVNPLSSRQDISLRVRNLDSDSLKVNDAAGNPVDIAAVINWQVRDTAMALLDVQDYAGFVRIQAEAAIRHVASEFPYDAHEEGEQSLRGNADEVTHTLQRELQQRLTVAGVEVLDTRLRRLAYAPEIAGEMLRRQQASAVVAARQLIVEGALGMVESALRELAEAGLVEMSAEQRADLVANLLVVLVSDRGVQPVLPTGV